MLLMLRHPGLECEPSLLAEVPGAGGIMPIDLWNGPLEAVLKGNATRSIRGDSGGLEGKTDERIAQQLFLRRFNSVWAMKNCAVFGLNGYHCFIMTMVKSSPQKKTSIPSIAPDSASSVHPKVFTAKGVISPSPDSGTSSNSPSLGGALATKATDSRTSAFGSSESRPLGAWMLCAAVGLLG